MKVRIGVSLGIDGGTDAAALSAAVVAMEELGFDSLWLAERIATGGPSPPLIQALNCDVTTAWNIGFSRCHAAPQTGPRRDPTDQRLLGPP